MIWYFLKAFNSIFNHILNIGKLYIVKIPDIKEIKSMITKWYVIKSMNR